MKRRKTIRFSRNPCICSSLQTGITRFPSSHIQSSPMSSPKKKVRKGMDTHMRQSVKSTYSAASSRLPNKQAITKRKAPKKPQAVLPFRTLSFQSALSATGKLSPQRRTERKLLLKSSPFPEDKSIWGIQTTPSRVTAADINF